MSWKFDPERHSLASHGIKTTMSKLKDNKRKTLPKKWIKNCVDNHPHKAQMRKVAGEVYDKIQKWHPYWIDYEHPMSQEELEEQRSEYKLLSERGERL